MIGLPEPLEVLNRRLEEIYGKYLDGKPMFRVVWSEDQMEHRLMTTTKDGFQLLEPVIEEVPKYRQWVQEKYILEGLQEVPSFQQKEIGAKISYESIWVFEDKRGFPLPPIWSAIQLILETMRANIEGRGAKYEDSLRELSDPKIAHEVKEQRLKKLEEELFGNETSLGDDLAHKVAIVVPGTTQGKVN